MTASPLPRSADHRRDMTDSLLRSAGWESAAVGVLRQDASSRRYYRLTKENGAPSSAILLDAPPPTENTVSYEAMAEKLRELGFSVPMIYAADHENGLLLIEDFGDSTFFELITNKGTEPQPLLELAVDALVKMHAAPRDKALAGCTPYSDEYWLSRIASFLEYYVPLTLQKDLSAEQRETFLSFFRNVLGTAHALPPVLIHGDYVVQNLIHLPDRSGTDALGLIDFEDKADGRDNMCGSPAFDIAFLVHDVRADYPASLSEALIARFLEQSPGLDRDLFAREYAILLAAQAVKCLGLFTKLGLVLHRPEYLAFIPYCKRNLRIAFEHPALADIKKWMEENTPVF